MINHLKLIGEFKFGQHKTISCPVHLKIETYEEDDWAEAEFSCNSSDFIDGVRVSGELYFDSFPINPSEKHPIKPYAMGELLIRDGEESSKLNILIIEKTSEVYVVTKKIKRYFWHFFVVGKPFWDGLKIFPSNYRGVKEMNRIYACTNFRGYWPVGVASVIVAVDKKEAKKLLDIKLKESGIVVDDGCEYELTEININNKGAVILNSGEWK